MGIRMSDLARALLAAPGLGLCLFFFLLTVRFCVHLVGGVRRGKAGKWRSEVAVCLACLAVTLAMTVFLYAVHRGVLRWFLVAGTLGTLLFLEKKWGRPLRACVHTHSLTHTFAHAHLLQHPPSHRLAGMGWT